MKSQTHSFKDMLEMDIRWECPSSVWKDDQGAYTIATVKTQWDYELEGFFLSHCLGTKDAAEFEESHKVYSVRDALDVPHATILCQIVGKHSIYGASGDLLTGEPFQPEKGLFLRVLQVRGRGDKLAMQPYMQMVIEWFKARGGQWEPGEEGHMRNLLKAYCAQASIADFDFLYHYRYMLDEENNPWQWSYRNKRLREAYEIH